MEENSEDILAKITNSATSAPIFSTYVYVHGTSAGMILKFFYVPEGGDPRSSILLQSILIPDNTALGLSKTLLDIVQKKTLIMESRKKKKINN